MFDFGLSFQHLIVVVVIAVLVIGPKELPVVLRRFGQFMTKMRGMAREFQTHVDGAMKEAGMQDIQKDLQNLKSGMSAAMSPVQTAISAGTNAVMSASATTNAAAATPVAGSSPPSMPGFGTSSDFARYFPEGEGETRVQGRALHEAKP